MRAMFSALALAACAPAHQEQAAALMPECAARIEESALPLDCRVPVGDDNYPVHFEPGGHVTVFAGAQELTETNVSEYLAPSIEDVDGDGAPDILIPRESGNVNVNYAFWRNAGGSYVRLGEMVAVEIRRTAEGYLAVPARSGAADWTVAFYRVDPEALALLATVNVHAEADEQGRVAHATCTLSDAPRIDALDLTPGQAEAKFCAEPTAAEVFGR